MTAYKYHQTKRFRGQPVKVWGDRMQITIKTAQPQQGGPPTVGLSDKLLESAKKFNSKIIVNVDYPKAQFITTAKEWLRGAKKEEQASYYNIPWYIYRKEIPREAFEKKEEDYYLKKCLGIL